MIRILTGNYLTILYYYLHDTMLLKNLRIFFLIIMSAHEYYNVIIMQMQDTHHGQHGLGVDCIPEYRPLTVQVFH